MAALCTAAGRVRRLTFLLGQKCVSCFIHTLAQKATIGIDNFMQLLARVQKVLERDRPLWRRNHIYITAPRTAYPIGEFLRVRHSSGQQHRVDMSGEKNDDFLPNDTTLLVIHIVHFIKDDEFHIAN